MNQIITFSEFIAKMVEYKLKTYVKSRYKGMYTEKFDEEMENYYAGDDYEIHLNYLIETWKNSIDKNFNDDFKIDYNHKGTYYELWNFVNDSCPSFESRWLDDIFVREILVKEVSLMMLVLSARRNSK